jgi:hypothetical protein
MYDQKSRTNERTRRWVDTTAFSPFRDPPVWMRPLPSSPNCTPTARHHYHRRDNSRHIREEQSSLFVENWVASIFARLENPTDSIALVVATMALTTAPASSRSAPLFWIFFFGVVHPPSKKPPKNHSASSRRHGKTTTRSRRTAARSSQELWPKPNYYVAHARRRRRRSLFSPL